MLPIGTGITRRSIAAGIRGDRVDPVTRRLLSVPGLLCYLDCGRSELYARQGLGDVRVGFMAARNASAPGVHIAPDGQLIPETRSDVPLTVGGYWDATGFHRFHRPGWWVGTAKTNYVLNSCFQLDSDGDGLGDGWSIQDDIVGPVTSSLVDAGGVVSGGKAQRVQFNGESGKYLIVGTSSPTAAVAGETFTLSAFATGVAGATSLFLQISGRDANNAPVADFSGSNITLSATTYGRYTHTATLADRTLAITGFEDAGSGTVRALFSGGGYLANNARITISGSTNYNGTYTVSAGSSTQFTFTHTWDGDDGPAIGTQAITGVVSRVRSQNTGVGAWDFQFTGMQLEKSTYATSFVPTTTAALTRPKDVVTMATAGNRNAAEETIIMQVTPWYSPSADMFSVHTLLDNDNFGRKIEAYMFGAGDDSYLMCTPVYHPSWWGTTVAAGLGSYFTAYQPVTIGLVVRQSGTYAELYINGELVDSTTDAWQAEAWGAAMYMLSDHDGANQFDGLLNAMTVFNRALSAPEVAYVTNLLNGAA